MDNNQKIRFEDFKSEILKDYKTAHLTRQLSIFEHIELQKRNANNVIYRNNKEIAQIAMAKVFQKGDWCSVNNRDNTFMVAAGLHSVEDYLCQLYNVSDISINNELSGRVFSNHFSSIVGLGLASKLHKLNKDVSEHSTFYYIDNKVTFATIDITNISERNSLDVIKVCGVLQIPVAITIWDDGSVININELLKGLESKGNVKGFKIFKEKGWNYSGLIKIYNDGIKYCREEHVPVIFHIQEFESDGKYDCITKFNEWIIETNIATQEELKNIEPASISEANDANNIAKSKTYNNNELENSQLIEILNAEKMFDAIHNIMYKSNTE